MIIQHGVLCQTPADVAGLFFRAGESSWGDYVHVAPRNDTERREQRKVGGSSLPYLFCFGCCLMLSLAALSASCQAAAPNSMVCAALGGLDRLGVTLYHTSSVAHELYAFSLPGGSPGAGHRLCQLPGVPEQPQPGGHAMDPWRGGPRRERPAGRLRARGVPRAKTQPQWLRQHGGAYNRLSAALASRSVCVHAAVRRTTDCLDD